MNHFGASLTWKRAYLYLTLQLQFELELVLLSMGEGHVGQRIKLHRPFTIEDWPPWSCCCSLDLPQVVKWRSRQLCWHRSDFGISQTCLGLYNDDDDGVKTMNARPQQLVVAVDWNDFWNKCEWYCCGEKRTTATARHEVKLCITEAVMIYLNDGIPRALLRLCRSRQRRRFVG
jgi:hypothetical protein